MAEITDTNTSLDNKDEKSTNDTSEIKVEMKKDVIDISLTSLQMHQQRQPLQRQKSSRKIKLKDAYNRAVEQVTCFKIVGCQGMFILSLIIMVIAVHSTALYTYTFKLKYMNREGIWVFLYFSILFSLLLIYFLLRWKKLVKTWLRKNYDESHKYFLHNRNEFMKLASWYGEYFGAEKGKYYLWRLYLFELIENWVQFFNMKTIYLCNLPIGWNICFSFLLISESLSRAIYMARRIWFSKESNISMVDKNIQIALDIVIDIFFLLVPIIIMNVGFGIWSTVEETTWMLFPPSLSLFSKLRRLMILSMTQKAEFIILSEQKKIVGKLSGPRRKRASFFGQGFNVKAAKIQNKYFPRWAKVVVFIFSSIYTIIVFILLISQILAVANVNQKCDDYISMNHQYWEDGCLLKVPLCKDLLSLSCNCAVVDIKNHNMTVLNDKFVELSALRKVSITSGPLNQLPKNMEYLTQMNRFNVAYNKLQSFDVNIQKWKALSQLMLMFNDITIVHENLWQHPSVVNLHLNSNVGLSMPQDVTKINLPRVVFFDLGNNTGIIPNGLSSEQLPSVNYLYLDGNNMSSLSASFDTFNDVLVYLGVARCGLKELKYLESFKSLMYLDARNNSLTAVSSEIKTMINGKEGFESYFSGNPVCVSDKELNCAHLCTEYCWSESGFDNQNMRWFMQFTSV